MSNKNNENLDRAIKRKRETHLKRIPLFQRFLDSPACRHLLHNYLDHLFLKVCLDGMRFWWLNKCAGRITLLGHQEKLNKKRLSGNSRRHVNSWEVFSKRGFGTTDKKSQNKNRRIKLVTTWLIECTCPTRIEKRTRLLWASAASRIAACTFSAADRSFSAALRAWNPFRKIQVSGAGFERCRTSWEKKHGSKWN